MSDAWIGKTIDGRYTLRRLVGRGGMGVVYEADHAALDRRVAVKLIAREAASEDYLERFRREAKLASRITHEHLVHIYDVGTDASTGAAYMVMEYVEGKDVGKVLADGPMDVARAVEIARQMLEALQAVHAGGIVHRDIKPQNVMLADGHFVKLMDFGVARALGDASLTMTGHVMGTPQYMSPEQVRGHAVDHRTDLYAVGVTLFAMLAGKLPFDGANTAAVAGQHVFAAPPSLATVRAEVPAHVTAAVAKALAKKPDERFARAAEMAAALGGGKRAGAAVPAADAAARRPSKRGPKLVVAGFAAAAVIAVIAIMMMQRGGDSAAAPASAAQPMTPAPPSPMTSPPAPSPPPAATASSSTATDPPGPTAPLTTPANARPRANDKPADKTGAMPPAGPPKSCQCIPTAAPDVIGLCKAKGESLCRCDTTAGQTLCPAPLATYRDCDDSTEDCFQNGYACPDHAYTSYHLPGRADEPCSGYVLERFKEPTREKIQGHFECDVCSGAKLDAFRGQPGEACTGFYWRTGEQKTGTLAHCE